MKFVKGFVHVFFLFSIFFLTGCASQRYHRTPSGNVPFSRPLEGRVLVPFGALDEGVTSKGIVIEGREGQDVRAAADGTVVYADEGLRGYGKTLILEHSGELSTVYARNAELLVAGGQRVRRGQVIARVGRAGKGGAPQSYFELRRAARAEDPLKYFQ